MSLGARAARGGVITLGGQAARIAIQIVSVVVLVRLLTPTEYGFVAMALAIVGFGEVFRDFGLSSAAIQAATLSRGQRSNLLWINALIGLLLATIVFFGSGLIAALYGQPEVQGIAQALSLTFLLNGLAAQYRADLNRRLRFLSLAAADTLAPIVGLAAAIVAAVMGWGYWSLVAQQLVQGLVLLIALMVAGRWLPRLPDRTASIRSMLRFGLSLTGSQLIGYLANNTDSIIIGVRFGAAPLGVYSRAFALLMTPLSRVRSPTTTVALPILARLSDDPPRYANFVARGQLALGYTIVAGLGVVIGAAVPMTTVLLGDKWLAAIPILQLLGAAGVFQTLAYVGYWVYLSQGLTGALFRYTIVTSVIKIACIVIGSQWGVVGVAAGYAIAHALEWPISLWRLSRLTSLPLGRLMAGAGRIVLMTGVVSLASWGAVQATGTLPSGGQLAAGIVAGVAGYALLAVIVPAVRRDVRGLIATARLVLPTKDAK